MTLKSKRFLSIAAVFALIAVTATGALARGGFGPGWGGHHGMMGGPGWMASGGDPVASADQRLSQVKTNLGITPDQEEAWNAYADAVKSKATLMLTHRQAMFGTDPVTTDQRFAFRQQGMAKMQEVIGASRDLYGVLTPEQQGKAAGLIGQRCRAW